MTILCLCVVVIPRAEYKSEDGSTTLRLDRKDSDKDYTLDNCVPCCPECNFTKNERIYYEAQRSLAGLHEKEGKRCLSNIKSNQNILFLS